MSEQTMAALEKAICEHLADEGQGDITTAWTLVTSSTSMTDHGGNVWTETPEGQPHYATLGLLEAANIMHRGQVYALMTAAELEDE